MTEEQVKQSQRYYRDKSKLDNAELYKELTNIVSHFITLDCLKGVAHGMDSQVNESFKNTVSWFAPKNKVYAGSGSLHNQIAFAVGINSLGVLSFYKKHFRKMGIAMTKNVEHYLEKKEMNRMKKLVKIRTRDAKKEKNKRKYDKLKDHTRMAKMEYHKRQGTYRRGMNLDDPYGELLNGNEVEDNRKPPPTKKRELPVFASIVESRIT